MSGSDPSSTWSTFLSTLSPDSIIDENTFHRRFSAICAKIRQRDPQRLLARFLRYHDQINTFVSTLDNSTGHWGANSLSSHFWSKAYQVVEKALVTAQYDRLTQEYLPHLGKVIPRFEGDLSLFPRSDVVQRPLQRIFLEYLECYNLLLQHLDTCTDSLEPFGRHTSNATRSIASLKTQWEGLVRKERENPAAFQTLYQDRLEGTAYSNYNTTVGPYNARNIHATFERLELLGSGTFGEVHKVRETSTGTLYARKTARATDPTLRPQLERSFRDEVSIMQSLRHHHIPSVQLPFFDGESYSFLMLPVAECNLRGFMRTVSEDNFPRTELGHLTTWFGCLVGALQFAHSKDIKHEDIKPHNILVKDHQPYLTDFGCARDFSGLESSSPLDSATTGTPEYWPPEPRSNRGRKADVFSLGCVFSEMLTVRHQRTIDDFRIYRHVQHRDNGYAFRENLDSVGSWLDDIVPQDDHVGMLLKQQTLLMLERNRDHRASAWDVRRVLRVEGQTVFCRTCALNL